MRWQLQRALRDWRSPNIESRVPCIDVDCNPRGQQRCSRSERAIAAFAIQTYDQRLALAENAADSAREGAAGAMFDEHAHTIIHACSTTGRRSRVRSA